MKKTLFLVLPLVFITSALAIAAMPPEEFAFEDVPQGAYFYQPVYDLFQDGIIKGYNSKEFGPWDKINRADVATMLHRFDMLKVWSLRNDVDSLSRRSALLLSGAPWSQYVKTLHFFQRVFPTTLQFPTLFKTYATFTDPTKPHRLLDVNVPTSYDWGEVEFFIRIRMDNDPSFREEAGPYYDDVKRLKKEMDEFVLQ